MNEHGAKKKEPYKRLAEINRALTTSLNFDKVLDLIVENAAHLIGATVSLLLLVDKDGLLRVRAARGVDPALIKSFSGGMEEDVIRQLHKSLEIPTEQTLVSVPVIAKHSLNGLLVITRNSPLNQEQEWQLAALADQAAIALRNARLYEMELAEASRERDETLEALRESNEKIKAKGSAFVKRAGEILKRNALAQSQLVRDLLDLSRLHMGKLSLNREAVSLMTTIGNAVETVQAEATAKEVELKVVAPEEVLFVDADPLRIEQVVWNLLNNAVKFTPPGGTVTVRLSSEANQGVLSVEDTGEGIDEAFIPHVFEMFRQADATNRRRHGGLGIGLALVQQLVQLHDGTVAVSSEGQGQGAQFTIKLPLSRESKQSLSDVEQTDAGALSQMRILVVDDSVDTVDMLRRLFEMDGATVNTARSGAEALKIVRHEHFDVILSDISMPGMDGFELLRILRELPRVKDTPVLALTGFGRAEDVDRAKAEGFFSHVTKPIDLGRLVETLQELRAKHRFKVNAGAE